MFDVDPSNFPTVKAKFYAFDANGDQLLSLTPQDFSLKEDGIDRNVTSVSCPPKSEPAVLSSVLTIDISGSMQGQGIQMAKSAAEAWIDALPGNGSECALTAFTTDNFIVNDFTTDKNQLKNSMATLLAGGGTDFDAALLNPLAGSLLIAEGGSHKKVVVLITDGLAGGDEDAIVNKAKQINATVYCVIVGNECPQTLKDVSNRTGGMFFENINTQAQAVDAFMQIINFARGSDPCTITWESGYGCEVVRKLETEIPSYSLSNETTYNVPVDALIKLEKNPVSIGLGYIEPGTTKDTIFSIEAKNAKLRILGITPSNPLFTITDWDGSAPPFTLNPGDIRNITVSFSPVDSGSHYTRIEIEKDLCGSDYVYLSSFYVSDQKKNPLKVTHPDGGEEFAAGSDTTITWEGILPSDTVQLQYSTNNGSDWNTITNTASGLKYNWTIPNTPSDECLMKVNQLKEGVKGTGHKILGMGQLYTMAPNPDFTKIASAGGSGRIFIWDLKTGEVIDTLTGHTGTVRSVAWSPDGTHIVSGSRDNTIKIWDADKGAEIKTLKGHTFWVESVAWSPDGTRIVSGSYDNTIKIWDADKGTVINTLTGHTGWVNSVAWSPDGKRIVSGSRDDKIKIWDADKGKEINTLEGHTGWVNSVAWSPDGKRIVSGSRDDKIKIWDADKGKEINTLTGHTSTVNSVAWSPDGSKIASGSSDETIRIWDAVTGAVISTLTGHTRSVYSVAWSPDGTRIVSGSDDGTIKIWEAATGKEIKTLTGHTDFLESVAWSPDGSRIVSGSWDETIRIWDAATGAEIKTLTGHKYLVSSVAWSPNGSRIASGSWDGTVRTWYLEEPMQEDVSDSLWSIVVPEIESKDVTMTQYCANAPEPKDSIITDFITNNTKFDLRVDSITISGTDADDFEVFHRNIPFTLEPGETAKAKFRFHPVTPGTKTAKINIHYQSGVLTKDISAEAVDCSLEILTKNINLGEVCLNNIKDSIAAVLRNSGNMELNIDSTVMLGPDFQQFDTLNGGGSFSISPGEEHELEVEFSPVREGRTSTRIAFYHTGLSSPDIITLFAEGIKCELTAGDDVYIGSTDPCLDNTYIDSSITAIENNGKLDVEIDSIRIKPDDGVFTFESPVTEPFTVKAGAVKYIPIRFEPTDTGRACRKLIFYYNNASDTGELELCGRKERSEFNIDPEIRNITNLQPGETREVTFTIHNTGTQELLWQSPPISLAGGKFTITDIDPNPTPPGKTSTVNVRFEGGSIDSTYTGEYVFADTCDNKDTIRLSADVGRETGLLLKAGNVTAKPGDNIEIPIFLSEPQSDLKNVSSGIYTQLSFNANLLFPEQSLTMVESQETETINGEYIRTLKLFLPDRIFDGSQIAIPMKAALGNTDKTYLRINQDSTYLAGDPQGVNIQTEDGILKLNICREGGDRVINTDNVLTLNRNFPNPVNNRTVIEFILVESGCYELSLYDLYGRKIRVLDSGSDSPGCHRIEFSVSGLPGGMYFYQLSTNSKTMQRKMIINE